MNNGRIRQTICFAEFELDPAHRRLLRRGEQVVLSPKAFDLLVFLAENTGRVVTKDEILNNVWDGQFVEEANLTVQMSALRRALGEKKESPQFLVTVPGKGYEFIADIHNGSDEIVIEKHKFERLVVEEEIGDAGDIRDAGTRRRGDAESFPVVLSSGPASPRPRVTASRTARVPTPFVIAGVVAFFVLAAGGLWIMNKGRAGMFSQAAVEKQPKIKKLTNNGRVQSAVLSADGKFFAYVAFDKPNWQSSIHLGQVDGGSDVVLRPTSDLNYRVTAFSADGSWLYYTAAEPRSAGNATLYKMPVLGGVPQKLAEGISAYAAVSPDQKQIAFVRNDKQARTSTLIVESIAGGDSRELVVRPYEQLFFAHSLSWSADGKLIALSAANAFNESDDANQRCEMFTVSVADGQINQLTDLGWSGINRVEWLRDGSALAVTGRRKDSDVNAPPRRSLWMVDYPDGKARKIAVDLNTYAGSLSLASDARAILVVQGQQESNIWISPADDPAAARQITFGSPGRIDGWYGMDWTPDGRIVYVAWIGENSTIWQIDADGGGAKQLTPIGFRDERPSVTADGAYVVFQSNRSGNSEIWRVGTDGSDLRQLTNGEGISSHPSVTPDGMWIYYVNERGGESSVWRVSTGGGEPVQVIDKGSSEPRVSPDGKFVGCGYATGGKTSLAIFSIDGGEPLKLFDVPRTSNFYDSIRWTPDGKFITYRDWANGIWQQSVDGGEPQRIAGLPEEKLMTYGWSPDGKHLAITRGKDSLDAVLITDFK